MSGKPKRADARGRDGGDYKDLEEGGTVAKERPSWLIPLVAAAGVVGGAIVTGAFGYFSHQYDLDAKMIELSIGILRAEPTPETTPLREWALDVIDRRANFKFNAVQRAVLLKKELPFKGSWSPGYSEGFVPVPMPGRPR
jgi:hypothetical protein